MPDDTIALGQAEIVLDRWLKDLEAGGDKPELSLAAVMALAEAGAPLAMTREVARLACIAVHNKINHAGWSERELALFNAARAMLVANIRPENILPLVEAQRDLRKPKGRKPRKLSYRMALSTFAAAVTVLKKGRTVDATIAEIATPHGAISDRSHFATGLKPVTQCEAPVRQRSFSQPPGWGGTKASKVSADFLYCGVTHEPARRLAAVHVISGVPGQML
jgi:hypothetical protein